MKNTLGIIISFDSANDLRDLTLHRPVASVQFGGRYRAIDFMLSNLVNSGCTNVGILMRDKYQSRWITLAPVRTGIWHAKRAA